MAIDFVHTAELVDAVIAVLKGADGALHTGGLPANWFRDASDADEAPLVLLEHGDLADYAGGQLDRDLPCILVRGLGPQPTDRGGVAGVQQTEEIIRVVHVRKREQCYADDGSCEYNMTRARARYGKALCKALFNDPKRRLAVIDGAGARTDVTLTSTDVAGAQLVSVLWAGLDLGHSIGNPNAIEDVTIIRRLSSPIWAIACDLRVQVRSGGEN
jgi:hypothetical protein